MKPDSILTKASKARDKEALIQAFAQIREHTAMGPLQVSLKDIGDDFIVLEMPITNAARQPYGLLHGGVNMLLAESAASMHAAWGIDITKVVPVGIEINGSHLRSATEGNVLVRGRVVGRSRSFVVHQVDLFLDGEERHLCTARVTNYYLPVKSKRTTPNPSEPNTST